MELMAELRKNVSSGASTDGKKGQYPATNTPVRVLKISCRGIPASSRPSYAAWMGWVVRRDQGERGEEMKKN